MAKARLDKDVAHNPGIHSSFECFNGLGLFWFSMVGSSIYVGSHVEEGFTAQGKVKVYSGFLIG